MLVALDRQAQRDLTRAFNARAVRKHYVAIVCGHLPAGRTLVIDLPLRQGRKSRYRVARPARGDTTDPGRMDHRCRRRPCKHDPRPRDREGGEAHARGRTADYRPFAPDSGPPLLDRTCDSGRSSLRSANIEGTGAYAPRPALPPGIRAWLRNVFGAGHRKMCSARCDEWRQGCLVGLGRVGVVQSRRRGSNQCRCPRTVHPRNRNYRVPPTALAVL